MALEFSNGGEAVRCGTATDLDGFFGTAMWWMDMNTLGGNSEGRVLSRVDSNEVGGAWTLAMNASSRLVVYSEYTVGNGIWVSPVNSLQVGNWYHVAVVWDRENAGSDVPLVYIDGASVTVSALLSPSGTVLSDAGKELIIGDRFDDLAGGNVGFDGRIADMRMYTDLMPADRIASIYAAQGTDRDVTSLLRRWPMQSANAPGKDYSDAQDNGILTTPSSPLIADDRLTIRG